MRIAIITDTFLPKIDGIAISINNFCRVLGERGHQFQIFCPKYEADNFTHIGEHTEVFRFSNFSLPSYADVKIAIPGPNKIRKAFKAFQPDIIHLHTPGVLGQYAITLSMMYGLPLIGTYHTLVSEQNMYIHPYRLFKIDKLIGFLRSSDKKKDITRNLDKIVRKKEKSFSKQVILTMTNTMYERCDVLISPSHLIKKTLIESGVSVPIKVVSNGIDLNKYEQAAKTSLVKNPHLIHAGRISFEKNADVILKAFALVLKKIPGATLDIVGDGPALASLKVEARQLGIDEKVTFHGFVPHDDLVRMYPSFDLFLTASTMETQGLVALEAITCGLPCVGVDAFALPELIQHETNGFLAKPYDHIEMAERTVELLTNEELYLRFSKAGLGIAEQHNLPACATKLEEAYEYAIALSESA